MKKIFLMGSIVLAVTAQAQVTLQPGIAAAGLVQKNQLWNIMAVNSGTAAYECRLRLILTDRVTGLEVFTASTAQFSLPKGAKQLNVNTLTPIQYNYLSVDTRNNLQTLLPAGMYNACYSIISTLPKEETLAEECIQFDAEPLSPPMLVFPSDSSVLDAAPAQFSWTPPLPAEMFSRLHYEVLITEINEGQKADEAIQQNIPFYSEGNVVSNSLNYPGSAGHFEKNKWYAWQVVARDDRNYAGKTETWLFKINAEAKEKNTNTAPFIKLSVQPQETAILQGGILKMEYYNFLSDENAKIFITRISDNKLLLQTILPITAGQNFLQYDLNKKIKLDPDVYYEVKLVNSAGEAFYMKFKPENK
jgi:hypothetical protein